MDRQLTIEKRGENFHLKFHNYAGPWEGHQIEESIGLEEVPPPDNSDAYERVLGPNQCYLFDEMGFHPDLHALVSADRLVRVARLVQERSVHVLEGRDLLPLPARPPVDPAADASYVAYLEERHRSVWEKGPRAVAGALALRAIPALIMLVGLIVLGRHVGDKYTLVTMDEVFARAERPKAEQGLLATWFSPDQSHLLRHEIRTVRFAREGRMILGDGNYVAFDRVADVTPWLRKAQEAGAAIVLDLDVGDGRAVIDQVRCGGVVLARAGGLRRLAVLGASGERPPRTGTPNDTAYLRLPSLPLDDAAELEVQLRRRLSLEGRIAHEGDRYVLRPAEGGGVLLGLSKSNPAVENFLRVFAADGSPVVVDFVLSEVFPSRNRRDPARQREGARLIGVGEFHSASAQNHHVVGRI